MQEESPYKPPQTELADEPTVIEDIPGVENYKGIGGWLILVIIGLCLTFLSMTGTLFTAHIPIYTTDAWSQLTTPGMENYHPMWAIVLIYELCVNIIFMIAPIVALILMFNKSRLLPRFMIGYLIGNFILVVIDTVLASNLPIEEANTYPEILRSFVAMGVWGSYFAVSKRVQATFVN